MGFYEVLMGLYDFFVVEGVVLVKVYGLLGEQFEVLDRPSVEFAQQKHDFYDLSDALLSVLYEIVLYFFGLQLLIKFGEFFHE